MWKQLLPGLRMTLMLTVLTGLAYPGLVTALCQLIFPKQANGSLVTNESWPCSNPTPGVMRPMCPPHDSNFDAAGAGNRVAWVGHLIAHWQDEDSLNQVSTNETYAYTVTFFDWGAPNETRGFQVGPSRTYPTPPYPERDWNHEAVVRAFVMSDGSAFAVSNIGGYGYHVQLTRATADAVLPTIFRHDY